MSDQEQPDALTTEDGEPLGALFDVDELLRARTPGALGQTERMLQEAVQEAARVGKLRKTDLGLLGGALAGARSLDVAMMLPSIKGGYLVAQLLTPYREVCQALGLPEPIAPAERAEPAPEGRQDGTDWLGDHFGTPV